MGPILNRHIEHKATKRFCLLIFTIIAGLTLLALGARAQQPSQQPDHASCAAYRASWDRIAGGTDLTAMDRIIAIIPGVCPDLLSEALSRRAESARRAATAGDPCIRARADWSDISTSNDLAVLRAYRRATPSACAVQRAQADARIAEVERQQQALPRPPPSPPPADYTPVTVQTSGYRAGQEFDDCGGAGWCPHLVVIAAGTFMMGEEGYLEQPRHAVSIQRFAAAKYEITFEQWAHCVHRDGCRNSDPNDGGWGRGNRPVVNVSWDDASEYVQWLSRETRQTYRLLTEAEWEYAARAGSDTQYPWGAGGIERYANYNDVVRGTAPVGSLLANAFGLYDMPGNVSEWVEDCVTPFYRGAPTDGSAWLGGDCGSRIVRGGSFGSDSYQLRSAFRGSQRRTERQSITGFRVARSI